MAGLAAARRARSLRPYARAGSALRPRFTIASVQGRMLLVSSVCAVATACNSVPWQSYGQAPVECDLLDLENDLEWAGTGNPADVGLMLPGIAQRMGNAEGDIYVGMRGPFEGVPADPPEGWFCFVYQTPGLGLTIYEDRVPEGWRAP